jgi:hypothetical protein
MYMTLSHTSPWAKMTSPRRNSTILLEIPVESRKAWALNVPFRFIYGPDPWKRVASADHMLSTVRRDGELNERDA